MYQRYAVFCTPKQDVADAGASWPSWGGRKGRIVAHPKDVGYDLIAITQGSRDPDPLHAKRVCRKVSDFGLVAWRVEPDPRHSRDSVRIEKLISFKGARYPKSVILYAVYFYVRFPVSYRNFEEIMAERGVNLDHATLNRWVGNSGARLPKKPVVERPQRVVRGGLTKLM